MNKNELVALRAATEEDVNFIFASWLRGLYYGDSAFSQMKKQDFMENYHKILQMIMSKPGNKVLVACLKDDPYVIVGYAVCSETALHWVFVKKTFRNIGIARDLVPTTIKFVTHLTKAGLVISKKKDWSFNPFLI